MTDNQAAAPSQSAREFAERLSWMTINGAPDLEQWTNHIEERERHCTAAREAEIAELKAKFSALLKREYALTTERWKQVCASEVFQELKHGKFKRVLQLLQNQQLSCGKAAQSIAEIAHGCTAWLPDYNEDLELPKSLDKALERAEKADSETAALREEVERLTREYAEMEGYRNHWANQAESAESRLSAKEAEIADLKANHKRACLSLNSANSELTALREEVERLKKEYDSEFEVGEQLCRDAVEFKQRAEFAELRLQQAQEALRTYGTHLEGCGGYGPDTLMGQPIGRTSDKWRDCTCGLARAAIEEGEK